MSFESGLFKLLTNDAAVSGKVGTRVYPDEFPEGVTWPAILYSRPEISRDPIMGGTGVPRVKLLVECYGKTPVDSIALANDVANVLADYAGAADDVTILASNFMDAKDSWSYEKSETGMFFRELTFDIFYRD